MNYYYTLIEKLCESNYHQTYKNVNLCSKNFGTASIFFVCAGNDEILYYMSQYSETKLVQKSIFLYIFTRTTYSEITVLVLTVHHKLITLFITPQDPI